MAIISNYFIIYQPFIFFIMTRQDVAGEISKKTKLTPEQSREAMEAFIGVIKESLRQNKIIYLRGFGTFEPKKRASKVARNISAGTSIVVPATTIASFRPAKSFKKLF
jgi:DNA-binding protein HU-beta